MIFKFKKYIYIKKSSIFPNFLMEKPINSFAIANVWLYIVLINGWKEVLKKAILTQVLMKPQQRSL